MNPESLVLISGSCGSKGVVVPESPARFVSMVSVLLVLILVATVVGFVARREVWCRWWFEFEDPRSVALFRIVFAALLLCNVNGLWEHADFLFQREGMFTGPEAGHLFAPAVYSTDAPTAARIAAAIVGPFSILYVLDGPIALQIHVVVFVVAGIALMVGLRTRLAAFVAFVAMDGLLVRNFVFWEGTELVFRVFMAYLVCARSGHAFSIDAWLHRRRYPAAQDRPLIPAWPRRLAIVQLVAFGREVGAARAMR